jgi:hypothetical protein
MADWRRRGLCAYCESPIYAQEVWKVNRRGIVHTDCCLWIDDFQNKLTIEQRIARREAQMREWISFHQDKRPAKPSVTPIDGWIQCKKQKRNK